VINFFLNDFLGPSGLWARELIRIETTKGTAQTTLDEHIRFLESRGMVVNHTKTELILFTKVKRLKDAKISLKAGNSEITTVDSIRALGVSIDKNLEWTTHINNTQKRFSSIMSGLRIIANKLDSQQTLRVVTSQVFSIIYVDGTNFTKLNFSLTKASTLICLYLASTSHPPTANYEANSDCN